MQKITLYTKALKVSEDYLGPAGERFLRRQISEHLGIIPENLKQHQLHKLVQWTELAFSLLTNDRHEVNAFTSNLLSLASQKQQGDE